MHNLVADPTRLLLLVDSATTEGFPHHVALGKMASRRKVCSLPRIGPILNVGCYFEAVYPTSGTLVTLVWRCVTFWNIVKSSPRKMLLPGPYMQVSWSTRTILCVCVCVCVLSVCVLYHMITHLVNTVRTYIRICLTSITLCSICMYICWIAYERAAYAAGQNAEQIGWKLQCLGC